MNLLIQSHIMVTQLPQSERYFVTGAAGFVGANLLESLLQDNQEVHILLKKDTKTWRIDHLLSHSKLHLHIGTLEDKTLISELLKKVQPTVIYNLATRGAYADQNQAEEIFKTNLFGTQYLLDAARELKLTLFVNTSSSSEYGKKDLPMKESDVVEPDSFYAVSKSAATQLCRLYAEKHHVPVVTFRLFSVYGPWEEPGRLMPTLLSALRHSKSLEMASSETARDFIYIDDVVELYRKIEVLEKYPGYIFNVGTGTQSTLKRVTEVASRISDKSIEFQWQKMKAKTWDKNTWVAEMSFTERTLDWRAETSLEAGLKKMWNWMSDHSRFY